MKSLKFEKAQFLISATSYKEFPNISLDEMAIVGRSNVGKSSLINHLLKQRKLAKVSSSPGKTQLLNVFLIDDALLMVDLPGYGYAKVSKSMKRTWSETIDQYLNESKKLKLILFLIDSRHLPSKEDLLFFEWLSHRKIPFILILTKTDKLSKNEKTKKLQEIRDTLVEKNCNLTYPEVCYSILEGQARTSLIYEINKLLQ